MHPPVQHTAGGPWWVGQVTTWWYGHRSKVFALLLLCSLTVVFYTTYLEDDKSLSIRGPEVFVPPRESTDLPSEDVGRPQEWGFGTNPYSSARVDPDPDCVWSHTDWERRARTGTLLFVEGEFTVPTGLLPSVGNGYLGTEVHSDVLHVAGLYSGAGSRSHLAHIPSPVNVRVLGARVVGSALDTERGTYSLRSLTGENCTVRVEQLWYAHRKYRSLLVHELRMENTGDAEAVVRVEREHPLSIEARSGDLTMHLYTPGCSQDESAFVMGGKTRQSETISSPKVDVVFVASRVPETILVMPGATNIVAFLVVVRTGLKGDEGGNGWGEGTASTPLEELVCSEYAAHVSRGVVALRQEHEEAWDELWMSSISMEERRTPPLKGGGGGGGDDDNEGNRGVSGSGILHPKESDTEYEPLLPHLIRSSMYNVLSSIRGDWNQGVPPGGLLNGACYRGHVFWDAEVWIFPAVLLFHPDLARSILRYRLHRLEQALRKAETYGFHGAMFPWESAATGREVCPEEKFAQMEIHVVGAVGFACAQYFRATHDMDWLRSEGITMIRMIARFWASRASRWHVDHYAIEKVVGPDEYHVNVDNNAYTNALARLNLDFAIQVSYLLDMPVPDEWIRIAEHIFVPVDPDKRMHTQFDGYTGDTVKQADAILLAYPLDYPMADTVRHNDLHYFAGRVDVNGPAMTQSIFSIGWLSIGEFGQAVKAFRRNYHDHVRPPFMIWHEMPRQKGCRNFLTAAGGFLQNIVQGFAGIRLLHERMRLDPLLPPSASSMRLHGLHYMGNVFTILYDAYNLTIVVDKHVSGAGELFLVTGDKARQQHRLSHDGTPVVVPVGKAFIQAKPVYKFVRGVHMFEQTRFLGGSTGTFTCTDQSRTLNVSMVNDDFCDCPDGSDEPGTAACANGQFFCTHKSIPTSMVNDGVCDCCDGSEEYEGKISCDYVCDEVKARLGRKKPVEKRTVVYYLAAFALVALHVAVLSFLLSRLSDAGSSATRHYHRNVAL